ncbi:hypothetical protein G6F68_017133 [Rhizopus microsporus]|nr:hypothetical protein G6F68_017133 [Rhizopus microsporus]
MVKLAVLNAWAELQVASQRQKYLRQVLQPNLAVLSSMWLRSLQDYARIRLESDIVALSNRSERCCLAILPPILAKNHGGCCNPHRVTIITNVGGNLKEP